MRAERFFVLPFSIGCDSEAGVAVGKSGDRHLQATRTTEEPETRRRGAREVVMKSKKSSFARFLNLPKSNNISNGIQRLIRSIKSLSQMFGYKEEIDEEEEEEREMEIGFPTDVKHVTHIGYDGSKTANVVKGWEDLDAPESLSLPLSSVSLKQFERAMAAQSCTRDLGKA